MARKQRACALWEDRTFHSAAVEQLWFGKASLLPLLFALASTPYPLPCERTERLAGTSPTGSVLAEHHYPSDLYLWRSSYLYTSACSGAVERTDTRQAPVAGMLLYLCHACRRRDASDGGSTVRCARGDAVKRCVPLPAATFHLLLPPTYTRMATRYLPTIHGMATADAFGMVGKRNLQ